MISEEKFNALIPAQKQLIEDKNLLAGGFIPGHWLMMIVTEMSEAINAHRSGKNIPINETGEKKPETIKTIKFTTDNPAFHSMYVSNIKGTFQDEIADIYIRLMSYCAIRGFKIDTERLIIPEKLQTAKTFPEKCMILTGMLWKAHFHYDNDSEETFISQFFHCLNFVVLELKFKAETFIDFKMEFNKSMGPMNNKLY